MLSYAALRAEVGDLSYAVGSTLTTLTLHQVTLDDLALTYLAQDPRLQRLATVAFSKACMGVGLAEVGASF